MRRIKAIVYGVGAMGKLITRYMVEKGVNIVGAIDIAPDIVGKDLGEVAGLGYPLNVKISSNADAVLSEQEADIAVVAFGSEMERTYLHLERCIENGLNVITITPNASYPWIHFPELASKLDKLAKKHGVTICGGGNGDFYLINAVSLLTGVCHSIESITLNSKLNVDDFGQAGTEACHVGCTKDEFYQKTKGKELPNEYMIPLENVIADLGLTIKKAQQHVEPMTDNVDLKCKSLGKIVKRGEVTGVFEKVEIDTEQGIRFRAECILKLYNKDDEDIREWSVKGVPDTHLKFGKFANAITTCTQIVNRIPDIINSEPGFITPEMLPKLKFRAFPLQYYLKKANHFSRDF